LPNKGYIIINSKYFIKNDVMKMKKEMIAIGIVGLFLMTGITTATGKDIKNDNEMKTLSGKPDLKIIDIRADEFKAGSKVELKFYIKNIGAEASPYIHVGLCVYMDDMYPYPSTTSVPAIEPGDIEEVKITWQWPDWKRHPIRGYVDEPFAGFPNGMVDEEDETNNEMTEHFEPKSKSRSITPLDTKYSCFYGLVHILFANDLEVTKNGGITTITGKISDDYTAFIAPAYVMRIKKIIERFDYAKAAEYLYCNPKVHWFKQGDEFTIKVKGLQVTRNYIEGGDYAVRGLNIRLI